MIDNTPAFPLHNHGAQTLGLHVTGMSLRDYFAAKAMAASYPKIYEMFLVDIFDDWHRDGIELLATEAYVVADAMMEARK
jgi:hypothetical protein